MAPVMSLLHYQTAGESHGKAGIAIVSGLPRGMPIDTDMINRELARRQGGYGRGGRQRIETDTVEILSGVRLNQSTGAPITVMLANRDARIDDLQRTPPVHQPRPGHADLAGSVKWLTTDCRETLERASARETAIRVAACALGRNLIEAFGIRVVGFVRSIGPVTLDDDILPRQGIDPAKIDDLLAARDDSDVYCPDKATSEQMREVIRQAKTDGDTVGGWVETHVLHCPPGLGSCMNWDEKLDARMAAAVLGIQAFKAVEVGLGVEAGIRPGSQVHDAIGYDPAQKEKPNVGFTRATNNAGGLEGGMTNGQAVVIRGTMKPISTLLKPLGSIDLNTKEHRDAAYERSDVCAVSAASVVMENVVAFEIARAMREKFAGDSMLEMQNNFDSYLNTARQLPLPSDGDA